MDKIENLYMDKNIALAIHNKAIEEGWKSVELGWWVQDHSKWWVTAQCPITKRFYQFDKYGNTE